MKYFGYLLLLATASIVAAKQESAKEAASKPSPTKIGLHSPGIHKPIKVEKGSTVNPFLYGPAKPGVDKAKAKSAAAAKEAKKNVKKQSPIKANRTEKRLNQKKTSIPDRETQKSLFDKST